MFEGGQGTFAHIIMRLLNASDMMFVNNLKQRFNSFPGQINVLPEEGSAIPRAEGEGFFENVWAIVKLVVVEFFTKVVLAAFIKGKFVLKIEGIDDVIKEIDG